MEHLHESNMRIAVAVILPGDLLQHPATPVQKAMNITKKDTMKSAIAERPMSEKNSEREFTIAVSS